MPHTSPVFFVSAISQQYLEDFRIMLHCSELFVRDVAWPGQVVG